MTKARKLDLLAISVVSTWGFAFAALKTALQSVSPQELILLRFLPAASVLLMLLLMSPKRKALKSLTRRDLLLLAALGFTGVCAYNFFLNLGQSKLPSNLAALVIALNPILIAVCAGLWLKERIHLRQFLGLVLGLGGIAAVVLFRDLPEAERGLFAQGILISLGAPLCWGLYTAGLRRVTPRLGAFPVMVVSMGLGSLPLLVFYSPELLTTVITGPLRLWISLIFLILFCTVYGFTGWSIVVKNMPAARAGAFIYLVPLIAAFAGRWLLDEALDPPLLIGTLLVLGGIALATRSKPSTPVK